MAHNVRIRVDPNWTIGTTWSMAEEGALDAAIVAAVNGDGGGTWSPTANLIIQGAGVRFIGTRHTLSGVHSSVTTDGATKLLVHNDSDYCVLDSGHSGATQTVLQPISNAVFPAGWFQVSGFLNIQGAVSLIIPVGVGAKLALDLRVHNNATFASLALPFAVVGNYVGNNSIPTVLPWLGVFAQDTSGNKYPLCAATPYQTIAAPASPTAWVDGNATQTLTFTSDSVTSNPYVYVDTTQFTYTAELIDVSGAGSLAQSMEYFDPTATFTNILDIRPR